MVQLSCIRYAFVVSFIMQRTHHHVHYLFFICILQASPGSSGAKRPTPPSMLQHETISARLDVYPFMPGVNRCDVLSRFTIPFSCYILPAHFVAQKHKTEPRSKLPLQLCHPQSLQASCAFALRIPHHNASRPQQEVVRR